MLDAQIFKLSLIKVGFISLDCLSLIVSNELKSGIPHNI